MRHGILNLFVVLCMGCASNSMRIPKDAVRLDATSVTHVVRTIRSHEEALRYSRGTLKVEFEGAERQFVGRLAVANRDFTNVRVDVFPLGAPYALMLLAVRGEHTTFVDVSNHKYFQGTLSAREMNSAIGIRLLPRELIRLLMAIPPKVLDPALCEVYRLQSGALLLVDRGSKFLLDAETAHILRAWIADPFNETEIIELEYVYEDEGNLLALTATVPGESTVLRARVEKLRASGPMQDSLFSLEIPASYAEF